MNSDYLMFEAQVHKAAQVLALSAINFAEEKPDDSHTTLGWNEGDNLLKAQAVELNGQKHWFAIQVDSWKLNHFLDEKRIAELDFTGMSPEQLYDGWQKMLAKLDVKAEKSLHYDLPNSKSYQFPVFEAFDAKLVHQWKENRSTANRVFRDLVGWSDLKSPIRIWPHHFDTGGYFVVEEDSDGVRSSIGVGLAVADSMIPEPYY